MTTKIVALMLLCLMAGTAVSPEAKVTPLMSKDLPENPGKEMLMIIVEHAPDGSSPVTDTMHMRWLRTGGLHRDAGEGWKTGNADTGGDLL